MRCVIADDSSITRDRVRTYLRSAGHHVVGEAKNGKEAYDFCLRLRPDIAILDVTMPVMTGDIAGIRILQEKLAKHVFIASSQMQTATTEPILAAGCHIISKPFKHDKFVQAIARVLSGGASE